MSEREELAALLPELADADVAILLATARRLRVTMATPSGEPTAQLTPDRLKALDDFMTEFVGLSEEMGGYTDETCSFPK